MGAVYRAHDPRTGRDVAIKVAAERFSERFSREVHAVAALNHANICTLYDVGPDFLVMELVEGPTLAERIAQGAIPVDESLHIARQIAEALDAAHEKGIVHRDLKPGNVKVRPDGTVKVLDFGLAKAAPDLEGPAHEQTQSPTMMASVPGMIVGTAAYMSPEQARGKPVDKRADIWAFGVVLFEMLTGTQMFQGETVSDTLAAVLTKDPDWARVPIKARPLLLRCLQKDPKRRLRDIGDAMQLLEPAPQTPVGTRTSWLPWAVAGVLAVAVGVALWSPWRSAPAPPDVRRFQLPMKAAGAPFVEFSISPDGRYVAYMGYEGGKKQLWLHALDSLEAWSPPGSEANSAAPAFPFWSPDSKYVAVAIAGKLRKFSVAGGPPLTICDVAMRSSTSGAWNQDGVILIGSEAGLLQVRDTGGTPTPVAGVRKGGVYFPSFLPDSRHFLYTSSPDEGTNEGTFVGSLDAASPAPDAQPLLMTDGAAVFAADSDRGSDGYLLFRRENSLLSQPFDSTRLALAGDAVPLVDQVGRFGVFPSYSASANGVLIHHAGTSDTKGQLTWVDRQGRSLGTLGDPATFGNRLNVSPDGTQVAAEVTDWGNFARDVWVFDVSRGVGTRLTFGGFSYAPVWSPDSREIAFAFRVALGGHARLRRRLANGGGEEELLAETGGTSTSWSPDSRFLLYHSRISGSDDLWVLPIGPSAKPSTLLSTPASEREGAFSPDGRWVAYMSNETGTNEIYLRPFPESAGGKSIVSKGGAGSGPRWRRDGNELYYVAPDGSLMAAEISASTVIQAGEPKALFMLPMTSWSFAPAPDGNRFLVVMGGATGVGFSANPFTVVLNWPSALR